MKDWRKLLRDPVPQIANSIKHKEHMLYLDLS